MESTDAASQNALKKLLYITFRTTCGSVWNPGPESWPAGLTRGENVWISFGKASILRGHLGSGNHRAERFEA